MQYHQKRRQNSDDTRNRKTEKIRNPDELPVILDPDKLDPEDREDYERYCERCFGDW